jgi:rhamnosyltransferase
MKSKVAILMATFNGLPYIIEQIDSIFSQTDVDIRIFVSDDCSSDRTLDYLKGINKANITILDNSDQSLKSAGRNFFFLLKSINTADFDYVALADQDDIWFNDKITHAISYLENSGADCYSSGFLAFWNNGKIKKFNKSPDQTNFDFLFSSPGPGCTFVFKSFVVKSLQEYLSINKINCTVYHHDWAIYAWARSTGLKWIIDPDGFILYRQHSFNDTGANSGFKAIKKRIKWLFGGWYCNQIIAIINFIQFTTRFNNSVECFRQGRVRFLFGFSSYRRKKLDSILVFILIMFNVVSYKRIVKRINTIDSENLKQYRN